MGTGRQNDRFIWLVHCWLIVIILLQLMTVY